MLLENGLFFHYLNLEVILCYYNSYLCLFKHFKLDRDDIRKLVFFLETFYNYEYFNLL